MPDAAVVVPAKRRKAAIQREVGHFAESGRVFYEITELSKLRIPTISVVFGASTAGVADDDAGRVLAARITWFMQRLQVPNGLRAVGYTTADIPALVEGAKMPTADQLPDDISTLSRRQAVDLADSRFEDDYAAWLAAQPPPAPPTLAR